MKKPMMDKKAAKDAIPRLLKMLFSDYKKQLLLVAICILLTAIASTVASLFMNIFINIINEGLVEGWEAVSSKIFLAITIMLAIYAMGWVASFLHTRNMAIITQGFMNKLRKRMFEKMQTLPLKYFDTHPHGDIMSYYTNDIDALRELISRTLPQLITSGLILAFLVFYMLYLSAWMALVVAAATIAMVMVTKKIGGNSAKFFMKMQKSIATTEGFTEEMMNGQKVIKVFNHEHSSIEDFDKVNEQNGEGISRPKSVRLTRQSSDLTLRKMLSKSATRLPKNTDIKISVSSSVTSTATSVPLTWIW